MNDLKALASSLTQRQYLTGSVYCIRGFLIGAGGRCFQRPMDHAFLIQDRHVREVICLQILYERLSFEISSTHN
ncbi:MAG: hypothetical protein DI535_06250 [Citrobacter freundii]|nr:MAG: hypothetical protein DI535_06250 [Citrobacter freundii]